MATAINSSPTQTPLHVKLLSVPPSSQPGCPLFNTIPGEIRSEIFALSLADFPDPNVSSRYDDDTCYSRPSYFAPRKSDVRLIRTCRAIYQETWFLPFLLREQVHWLTAADRAPPEYRSHITRHRLGATLRQIVLQRGGEEGLEIERLRVFAQMYKLEEGSLTHLLRTPHLRPEILTLTIRHTDWWWWENDIPLRFEGNWIRDICSVLPDSVKQVEIELESLENKKDQVDSIAKQMGEKWFFKRQDGMVLFPDVSGKTVEVDRWTGSSTWDNTTWTRDESKPGQIDFYIAKVTFRPQHAVIRRGGLVSPEIMLAAEKGIFSHWNMRLQSAGRSQMDSEDFDEDDDGEDQDDDESGVHEDDEDEGEEHENEEP